MKDRGKTKEQLLHELAEFRRRFVELEQLTFRHMRTEEALQKSEEKYRSLVESTDDSVYLVDRDYKYLFMNKKHLSRLGFSEKHLIGRSYSEFHSTEETKDFIEKINEVFKKGEPVQHEHKSLRDGRYFLRTLSPVREPGGKIAAVSVISKNITEHKRLEEELRIMSFTDELTGLYNRRGFLTLAGQQLKMARRLKKGVFMLYADLDDLKVINDTFGHREGDLALMEAADILKETYRDSDIIGRIGGDEFAVFPLEIKKDSTDAVIKRLQRNLAIRNAKKGHGYKLSFSSGIAHCDSECRSSIEELLTQADKLMYEQKKLKH